MPLIISKVRAFINAFSKMFIKNKKGRTLLKAFDPFV